MSIATEQVAKNVLEGVVKTVGFFSGAVMKSKPGKKFFKLLPGEVALVSMDAFGKISSTDQMTSPLCRSVLGAHARTERASVQCR